MLPSSQVEQLRIFIDCLKKNPELLHEPSLDFFRNWLASLGAKIPEINKDHKPSNFNDNHSSAHSDGESEMESDLDLDTELIKEANKDDLANQEMGDSTLEVSEEMESQASEKRNLAIEALGQGNIDESIKLFTEAIQKNPTSAVLFAKRAQAFMKKDFFKSAIKDCDKALRLNPDSSLALRIRGKCNSMLGNWVAVKKDLAQSLTIDFDPDINDLLKKVSPNADKIVEHERKKQRKKEEREENARRERVRAAQEAHEKAANASGPKTTSQMPFGAAEEGGMPGGIGNIFQTLMSDPELMEAFKDPEVSAAFQDISTNPANILKYQSNPKVSALLTKLMGKMGAGGGMGGFPNM